MPLNRLIEIPEHPDLTVAELIEILRSEFGDELEIEDGSVLGTRIAKVERPGDSRVTVKVLKRRLRGGRPSLRVQPETAAGSAIGFAHKMSEGQALMNDVADALERNSKLHPSG